MLRVRVVRKVQQQSGHRVLQLLGQLRIFGQLHRVGLDVQLQHPMKDDRRVLDGGEHVQNDGPHKVIEHRYRAAHQQIVDIVLGDFHQEGVFFQILQSNASNYELFACLRVCVSGVNNPLTHNPVRMPMIQCFRFVMKCDEEIHDMRVLTPRRMSSSVV